MIWGFPQLDASLFVIRPYLLDLSDLRRDKAAFQQLIAAIDSMSAASAEYKGIGAWRQRLVDSLLNDD